MEASERLEAVTREARRTVTEHVSERVCVVCGSQLTIKVTHEYRGDPMHAICGPGSRAQRVSVSETCCDACGLSYVSGGGITCDEWNRRRELDRLANVAQKIGGR